MNPTVYDSVKALCDDPHTDVIIFSGSDKAKLEETFGELDVWLAAENGMFIRPPYPLEGDEVRLLMLVIRARRYRHESQCLLVPPWNDSAGSPRGNVALSLCIMNP